MKTAYTLFVHHGKIELSLKKHLQAYFSLDEVELPNRDSIEMAGHRYSLDVNREEAIHDFIAGVEWLINHITEQE